MTESAVIRSYQTHQIKPTRSNPPDQTHQIKPTRSNPPDQTHQIKPTRSNPPDPVKLDSHLESKHSCAHVIMNFQAVELG